MKRLLLTLLTFAAPSGVLEAQAIQTTPNATETPASQRLLLQQAYRNWRLADPNLESDAAGEPTAVAAVAGDRAAKVGVEAGKYFDARKIYFDTLAGRLNDAALQTDRPAVVQSGANPADANISREISRLITSQTSAVSKNLAIIPKDSDPAFRELRRALEREQAALNALQETVKQKTNEKETAEPPAADLRIVRAHYLKMAQEVKAEAEDSSQMAAAWANYYSALAEGAREASLPKPAGQSVGKDTLEGAPALTALAAPSVALPSLSTPTSNTPASNTSAGDTAAVAAPRPVLRDVNRGNVSGTTSVTPTAAPLASTSRENTTSLAANLPPNNAAGGGRGDIRSAAPGFAPVGRYVGAWTYPTTGEHYHGAHPESVELNVRQENDHLLGTMRAKFRLPPGSKLNPNVEFTFTGSYQVEKMQTFAFASPDGTQGTVELIPAATFNLLEINFTSPDQAGKITHGNFFLIRK